MCRPTETKQTAPGTSQDRSDGHKTLTVCETPQGLGGHNLTFEPRTLSSRSVTCSQSDWHSHCCDTCPHKHWSDQYARRPVHTARKRETRTLRPTPCKLSGGQLFPVLGTVVMSRARLARKRSLASQRGSPPHWQQAIGNQYRASCNDHAGDAGHSKTFCYARAPGTRIRDSEM